MLRQNPGKRPTAKWAHFDLWIMLVDSRFFHATFGDDNENWMVRCSWTKGHATSIDNLISTELDLRGNDGADKMAKEAAIELLPSREKVNDYMKIVKVTILTQAWMIAKWMAQVSANIGIRTTAARPIYDVTGESGSGDNEQVTLLNAMVLLTSKGDDSFDGEWDDEVLDAIFEDELNESDTAVPCSPTCNILSVLREKDVCTDEPAGKRCCSRVDQVNDINGDVLLLTPTKSFDDRLANDTPPVSMKRKFKSGTGPEGSRDGILNEDGEDANKRMCADLFSILCRSNDHTTDNGSAGKSDDENEVDTFVTTSPLGARWNKRHVLWPGEHWKYVNSSAKKHHGSA